MNPYISMWYRTVKGIEVYSTSSSPCFCMEGDPHLKESIKLAVIHQETGSEGIYAELCKKCKM